MAVFDNTLMFRTTGNLTQSESSSALTIRGTPVKGIAARVVVPGSTGTTTSVLPRLWVSADNSSFYLASTYPKGAITLAASGTGEYIVPLTALHTEGKYVKLELVVTGTTPNFGAVVAGLVLGVGGDWDRSVSFA
jgi:hypothetical protein